MAYSGYPVSRQLTVRSLLDANLCDDYETDDVYSAYCERNDDADYRLITCRLPLSAYGLCNRRRDTACTEEYELTRLKLGLINILFRLGHWTGLRDA
jgi:hypothetical protein